MAQKADWYITSIEKMLETYTLSVFTITNKNGDPLLLPNDGPNFSAGNKSFNHYIPNIAFSSLNVVEDLSSDCYHSNYEEVVSLVNDQLVMASNETDFASLIRNQYYIDMFHSGIANSACIDGAKGLLNTQVENITQSHQTYCLHDPVDEEELWLIDPCCNFNLLVCPHFNSILLF